MDAERTTRLASVAASTALLMLTILIAVPWGVPADWRLSLLMLPAGLAQASALSGTAPISPAVAFGAGILIDVATDTPPGLWSLALLVVVLAATWAARQVGLSSVHGAARLLRVSIAAAPAPALLIALLWAGAAVMAPGSMSFWSMLWAWLSWIGVTVAACGILSRIASGLTRPHERDILRKA